MQTQINQPKHDDISLSNGTVITHKPETNGSRTAFVKDSDRFMTSSEWEEYCQRKFHISQALHAGKNVPESVLAEFPLADVMPHFKNPKPTAHLPELQAYDDTIALLRAGQKPDATPGSMIRAPLIGKVIALSTDYIVQDIGKGKRVWHAYNDLDLSQGQKCGSGDTLLNTLVYVGNKLEIKYGVNGKGTITNLDMKALERTSNTHTR